MECVVEQLKWATICPATVWQLEIRTCGLYRATDVCRRNWKF